MDIHLGVKYPCKICGKTFGRQQHLTRHLTFHQGEKREMCPICGSFFHRVDNLRQHLYRVHKDVVSKVIKIGNESKSLCLENDF